MKIFNTVQIKACDEYTIVSEPVTSIDLMERAAGACVKYLLKNIDHEAEFVIFCGKGNNGGDGLAIARQLSIRGFSLKVFVIEHSSKASADFSFNLEKLKEAKPETITSIENELEMISMGRNAIIIDALIGSGLNKKAEG